MARPFYVTTPIYYVNDVPHIGHAYTTIAADVLARYHRMLGDEVFFLTGTDEHGQKIQEAAEAKGETPKALADRVVVRFQEAWKNLNISNNAFIRTTDAHHIGAVKKIWKTVADHGDIKLDIYEDWYCTPCETFLTETQLQNGKCPQCSRDVKKIKEESYFFKLSAYQKQVLAYCTEDHVLPKTKANEVKNFVNQGLRDLSISRTSFNWGIPVPGDPKHVMYVWFDALFNYVTALGYGSGDNALYEKFWPADVHIVGKDILRFHTVYWPAFLDSAGMKKPKTVFAHGWWTIEGKKMSKSLGNVVDPNEMVARYGADAFRYFLMREVPFGEDGDFSIKALEQRINSDLANDLGNLLSRSISMHLKYFGDKSVASFGQNVEAALNVDTRANLMKLFDADAHTVLAKFYGNCQFHNVLHHVWQALGLANGYIDRAAPWKLVKETDEDSKQKLKTVMNTLLETLRLTSLAICPFMPTKANQIWAALGLPGTVEDHVPFEKYFVWQNFPEGLTLTQPEHLFPRIDLKK